MQDWHDLVGSYYPQRDNIFICKMSIKTKYISLPARATTRLLACRITCRHSSLSRLYPSVSSTQWHPFISQQCGRDAMFDLSAWGPNLLKLEHECLASAAGPASGSGGSAMTATDRRPRKTSRCSGAASDAREENHNHNAAITAVSNSPGWSAPPSLSQCLSSTSRHPTQQAH